MALDFSKLSDLAWLDQERLSQYSRHLPLVVSLLLILAIAYSLADTTWKLFPAGDDSGAAPAATAQPDVEAIEQEGSNLDQLIALSVFGEPDPEDEADQDINLAEVDAPETQLNLELRGVLATEIPDMARAIIASDSGDDESFKVGDSLGSGASVRAIYSDRVILERGGELETLRLPREEGDGLTLSTRDNGSGRASRNGGDERVVPEDVADLRSAIEEDPERITDVIRPTPHHVDGEMVGFRIFPGRMRDAFRDMGLRAGDVVTAVNGQNLDSPAAGMQLLNDLKDASSVELTIQRGGEETRVTITLGQ